ncbi:MULTISPECIES: hypothetical protein [Mesorhizobium]|uniref:hypothetical protein n=1 Tax=Mesorhizobium TaxID=68287 RepID=UPI00319D91BE
MSLLAPAALPSSAAAPAPIIGALILTVLTTLQMPEGAKRILFGLIVLFVTAACLRIVEER